MVATTEIFRGHCLVILVIIHECWIRSEMKSDRNGLIMKYLMNIMIHCRCYETEIEGQITSDISLWFVMQIEQHTSHIFSIVGFDGLSS